MARRHRRLIVNADDFGFTDGVSLGILRALADGIVTGTTAMACVDGSLERLARWAPRLTGRAGVHLQLTDGLPCLPPDEVPTLVGEDGRFRRSWRDLADDLDTEQVRREWMAQVERLVGAGLVPTHLDSHHSVHHHPRCLRAYVAVARHFGLPVRGGDSRLSRHLRARGVACGDLCVSGWRGSQGVSGLLEQLEAAFQATGDGATVELMCHPAVVDEALRLRSTYVEERERELEVLCAPEIRAALGEREIILCSPADLAGSRAG